MQNNNLVYLHDIIEACEKILAHTDGISYEYFLEDELLTEFVIRKIEIIGEACRCFDEEFVNAHKDFPIKEASGMRNKLIHEYKTVSTAVVWATVQNDIKPLFVKALEIEKELR